MSAKRAAPTELNHDNWDQDDTPNEEDEQGQFKMATKEVLEKRVIRTAKRRSQATNDEEKKGVFSGFSGFNKAQKPSFDFLASLTNGKKTNIDTSVSESETTILSNSLISKPSTSPSSGIFDVSGTSTPITKSVFGQQTSASLIFGATGTPAFTQSVYSTLKPTVSDNPFKVPSTLSSIPNVTLNSNPNSDKTTSQASTTLFAISSTSANMNNSPFANTNSSQAPIKTAPITNCSPKSNEANKSTSKSDIKDDKRREYYTNLKGLNVSVSAWIRKHVEETPLCILSPIFRDYEKHLKNIQDEYEKYSEDIDNTSDVEHDSNKDTETSSVSPDKNTGSVSVASSKSSSTLFSQCSDSGTSKFSFGITTSSTNTVSTSSTLTTGFSFGIKPSNSSLFATNTPTTNLNSSIFGANSSPKKDNSSLFTTVASTINASSSLFAAKTSTTNGNSSPFALNTSSTNSLTTPFTLNSSTTTVNTSPFSLNTASNANTSSFTKNISPFAKTTPINANSSPFAPSTTSTNGSAPFSFGIGKPFGFSSNIKKTDEPTSNEDNDNEEEQPKVEYTPIVEENSVYDKKCKVYVKKDGNFTDKGVGTLYIKKIDDSGKYQLLVRANTSLGNVLLNLILSSSIPTQRMGKNNVMMVCIPTPDAKPPPTSVLIRVKTSEDADDLLETLNKYKA